MSTERPILMGTPMVRATLANRKTQTRRLVTPQPTGAWRIVPAFPFEAPARWVETSAGDPPARIPVRCPYVVGETLYVRERLTCAAPDAFGDRWAHYAADGALAFEGPAALEWRWKRPVLPSIHMPRAACRIRLRVEAVRVERLRDITEDDAKAEGVTPDDQPGGFLTGPADHHYDTSTHRGAFAALWQGINGKRAGWSQNPLVFVVTFSRRPA